MNTSRILKRSALAVAGAAGVLAVALTVIPQEETPAARSVKSPPLLAAALTQAASLPFACQEAIFKTGEQFATTRYAIPDEFRNATVAALGNLTET